MKPPLGHRFSAIDRVANLLDIDVGFRPIPATSLSAVAAVLALWCG